MKHNIYISILNPKIYSGLMPAKTASHVTKFAVTYGGEIHFVNKDGACQNQIQLFNQKIHNLILAPRGINQIFRRLLGKLPSSEAYFVKFHVIFKENCKKKGCILGKWLTLYPI